MRALLSRVRKLEDRKQQQQDAKPYSITSPCGRVVATITPGTHHWAVVSIAFPYPDLSAPIALDLVKDQLPLRCAFVAQPNTTFTVEEYEAWVVRDGPQTDGSPLLFGRYERTVH